MLIQARWRSRLVVALVVAASAAACSEDDKSAGQDAADADVQGDAADDAPEPGDDAPDAVDPDTALPPDVDDGADVPHDATAPEDGLADGLAVDAAGGLWLACFGGGTVRHYAPDGDLRDVVDVGVEAVTSCAFGGPDLGDLYVTTATVGVVNERVAVGVEPSPLGGALLRMRPGVRGCRPHRFAG